MNCKRLDCKKLEGVSNGKPEIILHCFRLTPVARGPLEHFNSFSLLKNYFRLNSIARGLPSHFSSFKPKWLCDGLTANPNQSYSIACDNSFQITAGDTVKAYTRTNSKRNPMRKPNRNQNCHKQRSTIHKLTKDCKIYLAPKARINSIAKR